MSTELTNIYKLSPEMIDRLLHTGSLTACYFNEGGMVICDFTFENGNYIMRMRGGQGVGSNEEATRDFARIVINMSMGSATYTHKQEAHTEEIPAIRPEICQ